MRAKDDTVAPGPERMELGAGVAPTDDEATRRQFLQKVACLGLGGCALLGPGYSSR